MVFFGQNVHRFFRCKVPFSCHASSAQWAKWNPPRRATWRCPNQCHSTVFGWPLAKKEVQIDVQHPAKSKDTLCFWQLKLAIHTSIFHFSSSGDGDWNLLQVDGGLWWWMWWYPFWKDKASMTWYGGHHISYPSVTMSKNPGKETHPFHQKSKIKITIPMVSNTSKALVHAGIVVAIDNNTCKAKVSQHKTSPLQGSLCG